MLKPEPDILKISDLSVGYKKGSSIFSVFSSINSSAKSGELIGLIGKNGSGKSTLLRTIVSLQPALAGRILLKDKNLVEYSHNKLAKEISFVSTEILRASNLSVHELVCLGRFPYTNWLSKLTEVDILAINKAINRCDIEYIAGKKIEEISDGERQRTMIARVLAQDTPLIVLDEPTSFLDMPTKYEIIHLLNRLTREEGKTIIFSSHDLSIAIGEVDKLWLMDDTKLTEGSAEDLILNGNFEHLFKETKLSFDIKTGNFKIKKGKGRPISLKGKGIEYEWTKKALERLNLFVDESLSYPSIEIKHNKKTEWILFLNDNTYIFNSIYELISYLRKIFN